MHRHKSEGVIILSDVRASLNAPTLPSAFEVDTDLLETEYDPSVTDNGQQACD